MRAGPRSIRSLTADARPGTHGEPSKPAKRADEAEMTHGTMRGKILSLLLPPCVPFAPRSRSSSSSGCGPAAPSADGGADAATADAGPPDAGPAYPSQCENINPADCLLPWPSSFFMTDDSSTATGRRIDIAMDATPVNARHRHVDPAQLNRFDGFSPDPVIMTAYPGEVDPATLNDENAIDATLDAGSTTLLIDAESGDLVPHFAELLDTWPETDRAHAPLYIRPAVRLAEGHRYVVAVKGVQYTDWSAVEASTYFAALRDGTPLEGSDVEDRRAHFEDIFDILDGAGVTRSDVIEAWDFETASGEMLWGDLIAMRDDALGSGTAGDSAAQPSAASGARSPTSTRAPTRTRTSIAGWRAPSPSRSTSTAPTRPQSTSRACTAVGRHADGQRHGRGAFLGADPRQPGYRRGGRRARLGGSKGLRPRALRQRRQIQSGWHRDHQNRLKVVSVAVDWWGMSGDDVGRVTSSLLDFSSFYTTGERLEQGVINFLVLARSFKGVCSELPEMQVDLDDGSGTAPAIDTSAAYYYGNSQGGIMGGVVAGVAVDIERFALGVGGMSYPLLIKRSGDWRTFDALMSSGYRDPFIRNLLLSTSSNLWDVAEPATYAPHLIHDPLPNTPAKHILMQIGIGDSQVPNVGSALEARTIGIPDVTPSPWDPWGLDSTTAPPADGSTLDSALVIYHIPGADMLPAGTRDPSADSPAHEGVRAPRRRWIRSTRSGIPTGKSRRPATGSATRPESRARCSAPRQRLHESSHERACHPFEPAPNRGEGVFRFRLARGRTGRYETPAPAD